MIGWLSVGIQHKNAEGLKKGGGGGGGAGEGDVNSMNSKAREI